LDVGAFFLSRPFVGVGFAVAHTHSQKLHNPALLYLVPSLLFGVFVVAASWSEATLVLDYKGGTAHSHCCEEQESSDD
jgi:hypothetical protein